MSDLSQSRLFGRALSVERPARIVVVAIFEDGRAELLHWEHPEYIGPLETRVTHRADLEVGIRITGNPPEFEILEVPDGIRRAWR